VQEEDLAEFVRGRYVALLRRAVLLVGDRDHAEDLVQEALARLWTASRRTPVEHREAYTRQVMVRLAISRWRRARVRPTETPTDPAALAPVVTEDPADPTHDPVWRAVSALPPRQRAVLVLRYYEDLTEAEICATLGISPGTVRSQTSKARHTLRRLLDPALQEAER
jgi:RNA polymerase sigma-70 factor, ECF subfamily